MNTETIKYFRELLKYLEYHNMMAPFPVFDTEYVGMVRNKIKELESMEEDYDDLPVAACKYCNSLHIQVDDVDNDICMRCGSINDIIIYKDIYQYIDESSKQE